MLECKYELKKLHNFRFPLPHAEEDDEEVDEDGDEEGEAEEVDTEETLERHHQPDQQQQNNHHHWDRIRRRTLSSKRHSPSGGGGEEEADYDGNRYYESGEALYSVKWYKDDVEFYNYLPKSNPPQHSYRVEGIRVDVSIR